MALRIRREPAREAKANHWKGIEMSLPTDRDPMLLTVGEVAALLRCSQRSVWAWSSSGKLPAPVTIGWRSKRWLRREIDDWLMKKIRERNR